MVITANFNKAANDFRAQMDALRNDRTYPFLKDVPRYDKRRWDTAASNCANFAFQRLTDDFQQPGALSKTSSVELPGVSTHDLFLQDGAKYLGEAFLDCPEGYSPAALFFGDDSQCMFHWRVMLDAPKRGKQHIVWGEKPGCMDTQIILADQTIFDAKHKRVYPYFAGYYGMPVALRR